MLASVGCTDPVAPVDSDLTPSDISLATPAWAVDSAREERLVAGYPFRWYSGVTAPQRNVIRSREAFGALWTQLQRGFSPAFPAPGVDFGEEMVLFVALGQRSSGGHAIRIRHVTLQRDTLWVLVQHREPGTGCVVTTAFTQPTDIRVVPRADVPVRYRIQREVTRCE